MLPDKLKLSTRFLILGAILLSTNTFVYSQAVTLTGIVTDAETKLPIAYARVLLCESPYGVLTNELGEFSFYIDSIQSGARICVSSLGYAGFSIGLEDWGEDVRQVGLAVQPLALDSVLIADKGKMRSPIKIMRKAFDRLKENYPVDPFRLKGYYRDYQVEGSDYLNLMESAIEVYDPGFLEEDFRKSQYRLLHLNINEDYQQDSVLIGNYAAEGKQIVGGSMGYRGQNEFALMRLHDPIRNYRWQSFSMVDKMRSNFIRNHEFELKGASYLDDKPVYEIHFSNKPSTQRSPAFPSNRYLVSGKIFIMDSTFAITDFHYLMEMKSRAYTGKMFEVNLAYRPYKDKMYLNYLSFSNYFEFEDVPDSARFSYDAHRLSEEDPLIGVEYSYAVSPQSATNPKNYEIRQNGIRQKIDQIWLEGNKSIRILLASAETYDPTAQMSLNVNGVKDYSGAKLGEVVLPEWAKRRKATQFREFFVSEIIDGTVVPFQEAEQMQKANQLRNLPIIADKSFWDTFNRMRLTPLQQQ